MLNFATDWGQPPATEPESTPTQTQTVRDNAPTVTESVTLTPATPTRKPGLPQTGPETPPTQDWEPLRDYVLERITALHGSFPREVRQENTIFMGFYDRWRSLAMPIATHAFEQAGGWWLGAPISVARFAKSSDGVFAHEIAKLL